MLKVVSFFFSNAGFSKLALITILLDNDSVETLKNIHTCYKHLQTSFALSRRWELIVLVNAGIIPSTTTVLCLQIGDATLACAIDTPTFVLSIRAYSLSHMRLYL